MTPQEIVDSAINDYGRKSFYGLLSGGKDSMSVTHYIAENYSDLFKGVVFCDTTIGLAETKEFVQDECQRLGWDLHIRTPKIKNYRDWVMQGGFPQAGSHSMIMRYIKYDAMRSFALERLDEHPCMVSGVRQNESVRRMSYNDPVNHDGNLWFVCPFLYKSTEEVYVYLSEHNLKKSPAYQSLHISGDCLCGAFSRDPSEILMLRAAYPEMYEKIKHLELDVKLESEKLEVEIRMMERKGEKLKDSDHRKKRVQRVKRDPNIPEIEKKLERLSRLRKYSTWGNNAGALEVENQTTLDILICGECSVNTQ